MRLLTLLCLIIVGVSAIAQEQPDSAVTADTITIKNNALGPVFYYHGEARNLKELKYLMEDNPEAYALMDKARKHYNMANLTGACGGALVGYQVGRAIGGGEANWKLAGIGGVISILSILMTVESNNLARKAVKTFNKNPSPSDESAGLNLSGGFSNNGIGIILRF